MQRLLLFGCFLKAFHIPSAEHSLRAGHRDLSSLPFQSREARLLCLGLLE